MNKQIIDSIGNREGFSLIEVIKYKLRGDGRNNRVRDTVRIIREIERIEEEGS